MLVLAISGALLFVTSPACALAWIAGVGALEVQTQVALTAQLAKRRFTRWEKWGYLARSAAIIVGWAAGPALMMLTANGRFFLPGAIWAAGLVVASVTVSFRGSLYAAVTLTPSLGLFVAMPWLVAPRQGAVVAAVLAGMLGSYSLFAVNTAMRNHTRERILRRTQRKLAHEAEEVRRLAFYDALTGLANRRQLMDQIARVTAHAARHGENVALLLIDLDRFKAVNDVYGHACGDELLREVAQRLKRASRADDICARLGGDEFVVLAPGCGAQDAAGLARRVLESLAESVELAGATHQAGGSIGISVCAGGGACGTEMLREADLALYKVKASGRNAYCFYETELDLAVENRRGLEADLRGAITAGDIGVVYQPQFEGVVMVGVEALARWAHPRRGVVEPSLFIPLAEAGGLIVDLGLHVMRRAFTDSLRWPHLTVAINLSPVQLKTCAFLGDLRRLLASTGARAERIVFELTETTLLADDPQTQQALASIRQLGFSIALDDFGKGYSGLTQLRSFPIDGLKIDRAFVAGLPGDEISDAIIGGVVSLGRTLGLRVVAEGVETPAQHAALTRAGCLGVQGYLLGRPVAAEAIDAAALAMCAG